MTPIELLVIFVLASVQAITFSLTSRARNRDHYPYHAFTAFIGNISWFFCGGYLYAFGYQITLLLPYALGATVGSLLGSYISSKIEVWLHSTADGHIND